MQREEPKFKGLQGPIELIKHFPGEPFAVSPRLRWEGLEALRYRYHSPNEAVQPPLTHHTLLLFLHTPTEFELHCDGVSLVVPPRAGSILVVPAGMPARWRWGNRSDSLHIFLEPELVARVAEEAFELNPARVSIPPFDGLHVPQLRAAMLAVNDELTTEARGSGLAAESLANLLAVHLLRNSSAPRLLERRTDGPLPQRKLRAVVSYVEEYLGAGLTLKQMAAAAHLSAYHFARQFKAATGMSPHQYVIVRRIERAQQLMEKSDNLSLAEVAVGVGFSDQSQFSHHFRRILGVTPGQFRNSARIA